MQLTQKSKKIMMYSKIITHSGPFHADDLVAVALLCENNRIAQIVRTRDESVLAVGKKEEQTILVDVGGEYAPEKGCFDHHFKPTPQSENGAPLAAAGMVALALQESCRGIKEFINKVDLVDNGVKVDGFGTSLILHKCNPVSGKAEDFDQRFAEVLNVLLEIFRVVGVHESYLGVSQRIEHHPKILGWVSEYEEAQKASETRALEILGLAGEVAVFSAFEPGLVNVAHEAKPETLFTIFPSPSGEWMIQQVPVSRHSFQGRKQLPEAWAGKRGEELDALTGIPGCVFTHPGRFIAGNKTLEGAIAMAEMAVATVD